MPLPTLTFHSPNSVNIRSVEMRGSVGVSLGLPNSSGGAKIAVMSRKELNCIRILQKGQNCSDDHTPSTGPPSSCGMNILESQLGKKISKSLENYSGSFQDSSHALPLASKLVEDSNDRALFSALSDI